MRFLFHFLFAVLTATVALAAPTGRLQVPLGEKHRHAVSTGAGATTTSAGTAHHGERPKQFKLPYVVKAPSTHAGPGSGASHTNNKHARPLSSTPGSSVPSWIKQWRGPASWKMASANKHRHGMHFASGKAGSSELSCFCAGGSICCHTLHGLDCNAGYCGI